MQLYIAKLLVFPIAFAPNTWNQHDFGSVFVLTDALVERGGQIWVAVYAIHGKAAWVARNERAQGLFRGRSWRTQKLAGWVAFVISFLSRDESITDRSFSPPFFCWLGQNEKRREEDGLLIHNGKRNIRGRHALEHYLVRQFQKAPCLLYFLHLEILYSFYQDLDWNFQLLQLQLAGKSPATYWISIGKNFGTG